MALDIKPWDVAEILTTEGRISAYLEEAFEEGDPEYMAVAIGDIARARNMTKLAKETGLTRDTLYKSFSKGGNPSLSTINAVVKALGYQLSIKPIEKHAAG
jgi:probable addiction module antidote protein